MPFTLENPRPTRARSSIPPVLGPYPRNERMSLISVRASSDERHSVRGSPPYRSKRAIELAYQLLAVSLGYLVPRRWPVDLTKSGSSGPTNVPTTDCGSNRRSWRAVATGKDLHKHEWVQYWAAVRKQASRLLGRQAVPGVDYAMTEVVHCKSAGEKGVADAVRACSDRCLDRILGLSHARVVVALGAVAAKELRRLAASESNREAVIGPVQVLGATQFVLFLPHPNAHGVKSAECLLSDQERRMIMERLAG